VSAANPNVSAWTFDSLRWGFASLIPYIDSSCFAREKQTEKNKQKNIKGRCDCIHISDLVVAL
jgi:hypothetical protein